MDEIRKYETIIFFHNGETITGPYREILSQHVREYIDHKLQAQKFQGKVGDLLSIDAPGYTPSEVILLGLQDDSIHVHERWRRSGGVLGRFLMKKGTDTIACVPDEQTESDSIEAFVEGILLSQYVFDKYLKEKKPVTFLENIGILSSHELSTSSLERIQVLAQAVHFARDLINEPARIVTPEYFARTAQKIADEFDLECNVYDEIDLEKMGAGAFLAVAQGSENPPRMIHLVYRHPDATHTIGLAGKGITFDSGGLSLKPTRYMLDMKGDMTGAAVVLATIKAIAQLKPRVHIHAVLCCAENMPSGKASRPGDIVRALNGKTIEITNTDAEGRLVLADGMAFLTQFHPDVILDVATLTGACVVALGTKIAGYFATHDDLAQRFESSAQHTGESFWRLPLEKSYRELLKTSVADIKNSANDSEAGAIQGALFLAEFVENIPWIHCDVAGPFILNKPFYEWPEGATGFGVRTLVEFIQTYENQTK